MYLFWKTYYICEKKHRHLKKNYVYVILSYCHNICFLSQCFFLRTCFAKSVLNSINLFQGLSQGLLLKRSCLGSSVIWCSLVSSMIGSSVGSWILGLSHWVSKYILKFDVFSWECPKCSWKNMPSMIEKFYHVFEWFPSQLFALLLMKCCI